MGAVLATRYRAGGRRARTKLFCLSVRADAQTDTRVGGRVTRFLHDLSGKEWMERVHTGIEDRNRGPGTVITDRPDLVGLDQTAHSPIAQDERGRPP